MADERVERIMLWANGVFMALMFLQVPAAVIWPGVLWKGVGFGSISLPLIFVLVLLLGAHASFRRYQLETIKRDVRRARGYVCPRCLFSRADSSAPFCPECGLAGSAQDAVCYWVGKNIVQGYDIPDFALDRVPSDRWRRLGRGVRRLLRIGSQGRKSA